MAARETLRRCWPAAVLVCLIIGILAGNQNGIGLGVNVNLDDSGLDFHWSWNDDEDIREAFSFEDERRGADSGHMLHIARQLFGFATGIMVATLGLAAALAGIALRLLVGNPLTVGGKRFFVRAGREWSQVTELLFAFRSGYYVNILLVMLLRQLKTWLWGLLLVIPGIVKHYEYFMIPYLLAENPSMSRQRAFELSREIMEGQKMETFLLELSFFPWWILSAFTCGLVNLFWANPYAEGTKAQLYLRLRETAIDRGLTDSMELPGV